MSLRARGRAPTRHPQSVEGEETWVWSALGGLKVLNISCKSGESSKAAGKRKATDDAKQPKRAAPPSPRRQSSSSSSLASGNADDDIQMIVFNFDGTMTVAGPFVRDPSLFKNASTPGWALSESLAGFSAMTPTEHITNFGGAAKIAELKAFMAECMYPVDGEPIKIFIVCNGKSKAVRFALKEVGLLETPEGSPLVSGIVGSTDEPFASDSKAGTSDELGKWAAVEYLQKQEGLASSQVLWVATKDPDIEAVKELAIASIQSKLFEAIDSEVIEQLREATGLLTPEMEARAEEEAGAADDFADLL